MREQGTSWNTFLSYLLEDDTLIQTREDRCESRTSDYVFFPLANGNNSSFACVLSRLVDHDDHLGVTADYNTRTSALKHQHQISLDSTTM
jgi:hypothetical protein